MSSLQVNIPEALHYFLQQQVAAGRYASESEAVSEAVKRMEAQQAEYAARLVELRGLIQEGLDSGEAQPFDVEAFLKRAHIAHNASS